MLYMSINALVIFLSAWLIYHIIGIYKFYIQAFRLKFILVSAEISKSRNQGTLNSTINITYTKIYYFSYSYIEVPIHTMQRKIHILKINRVLNIRKCSWKKREISKNTFWRIYAHHNNLFTIVRCTNKILKLIFIFILSQIVIVLNIEVSSATSLFVNITISWAFNKH